MYNFKLVNADTDSIMVVKEDETPFTEEEQAALISELNDMFPEHINWDEDGYFDSVVVIKAKNYVLKEHGTGKVKTKGSGLKDSKKEPALRELMDKMVKAMLDRKEDTLLSIYHSYIQEALNVQEIRRWCTKKTITESITDCEGYTEEDIKSKKLRKNETDVWDAVKNEAGLQQGDKVYLYPTILETKVVPGGVGKTGKPLKDKVVEVTGFKMDKYWNNDHDVQKLVERVYKTVDIFKTVLDMSLFTDYPKDKYYKMIQQGVSLEEIDVIYKEDERIKGEKKAAKALKVENGTEI